MGELEFFCFDVMGDFIDPGLIEVDEEARTVTVRVPDVSSIDDVLIREIWDEEAEEAGFGDCRLTFVSGK